MSAKADVLPDFLVRDDGVISKSPLDVYSYKYIKLENGISVVVASNPSADKAAASMNVGVGNFCDPENTPGIAHFLEHMLFLGTEKYPSEQEYSDYLSKNGGSCNAWTDIENTNYMFDVGSDHLEGALDRFAQFFIAPLFTESATLREMNAVDSEHRKNLLQDYWRIMQLDRTSSNPEHPYHKFGTGSLTTLKEQPEAEGLVIMDILKKFHSDYYSANIMTLSIIGKDSVDVLEKWAREKFSSIVNKNVAVPKGNGVPFRPEDLGVVFKITPVRDLKQVIMSWCFPCILEHYKKKVDRYLGHLIGHEGPGSILSYIKTKGWGDSLSAGVSYTTRDFSTFDVHISLTEQGLENVEQIIAVVFQYIRLVEKEGIQEWIWKECQDIASVKFHYADQVRPFSYASTLSENAQNYSPEDILTGSRLYRIYDPEFIRETLQFLNPENVRIKIMSKTFEATTTLREKWYQTPYSLEKISAEQLKTYKESDIISDIFIVKPNPFMAKNFDLVEGLETKSQPTLVLNTTELKIWYKPSLKFKQPKAVLSIQFFNPICYSNPRNVVLTALFTDLVVHEVNEVTYFAEIAGLAYSFTKSIMGFELKVSGFNDNLASLAKVLVQKIRNLEIKEDVFEMYKEQTLRSYANFDKSQPYQIARQNSGHMLFTVKWHNDDQHAEAKTVTATELRAFGESFVSSLEWIAFVNGNMKEQDAVNMVKELRSLFDSKAPFTSQHLFRRLVKLRPGVEFVHRIPARNLLDENSAIEAYFQANRGSLDFDLDNLRENVLAEFVSHLMDKDAFHQLRTVEQLGYMVWSGSRHDIGVPAIYFLIQSPTKDPSYLNERVENFIGIYKKTLADMSAEDFETGRQGLIVKKLEDDKTIGQESKRLWDEIVTGFNLFDRQSAEVEELKKLSKEDVIEFFDHVVSNPATRRKLTVQVFGKDKPFPESSTSEAKIQFIEDMDVFKARQPLYPSPMN